MLKTSIRLKVSADLTKALDLRTAGDPITLDKLISLADGVGAGQADLVWADIRTLAASGTENLDLSGVLETAFGDAFNLVKVKALIVVADDANVNNVELGGAGTNAFVFLKDVSDIAVVKPGGLHASVAPGAGFAVTGATGDILKVTNSSGTTAVTYTIIIVGTSA